MSDVSASIPHDGPLSRVVDVDGAGDATSSGGVGR